MKINKTTKFIIITLSLLIIDIVSKYFFYDLQIGSQLRLIHSSFNIGIARSMPMPIIIIIILSIVALIAFIILFYRGYLSRLITGFLVAGTLGNLIDRILLGGVRDFLDIGIFNFPIFNGADLFLNIGIIIFIINEIWSGKKFTKK